MEPKFSPPSKWGISGLKVIFFFPLLPLGAIVGGVVDFFLCKRGGEAGKEGFSANEKKAWRKIWCGFFFHCGCNGHGAYYTECHYTVQFRRDPFCKSLCHSNVFGDAFLWFLPKGHDFVLYLELVPCCHCSSAGIPVSLGKPRLYLFEAPFFVSRHDVLPPVFSVAIIGQVLPKKTTARFF